MFEYEPYIKIEKKVYFPDFKLNNMIIEVTELMHPSKDKLNYMREKIDNYEKGGFKTILFISKRARKFYKEIKGTKVSTLLELKQVLMPS